MPLEPSVTSACEPLCECTLRYSSALLPKSFARPGPKSVSPATYCSGVKVVVLCKWIVDMRASLLLPGTPGILSLVLITPVDTAHTAYLARRRRTAVRRQSGGLTSP